MIVFQVGAIIIAIYVLAAVLPAALLCDEVCVVENLPNIEDIRVMHQMLLHLGCKVDYEPEHRRMTIDPRGVNTCNVPYKYTQRMRASSRASYRGVLSAI